MTHRWALVLVVALGLACLFPTVAPAEGSGVPVTGGSWYWKEQLAPVAPPAGSPLPPVAPPALPTPDVPAGDFPVSVVLGQADKESFLQLDTSAIAQGSTVSSLILTLHEDSAGGNLAATSATVEARAVTGFFASGDAGKPFGNAPGFDTTGPAAPGKRAGDGTWTFDLTPIAQRWASGDLGNNGVALVPAAPAQGQLYEVVWSGVGTAKPPAVGGSFTPPAPGTPEAAAAGQSGSSDVTSSAPVSITPDLSTPVESSPYLSAPAASPSPAAQQAPTTPFRARARIISQRSHWAPPWAFFLAVAVVIALIAASTLSLGDLGEPEPDRRGGVLRTLERRSEEVAT